MSWWAVGSAVVSVAGSAISSSNAASAQRKSNNATIRAAQETNEANKLMFDESRGSTGSALLPIYLSDYEKALGSSSSELAQLGMGNARGRIAGIESGINRLRPALDGSTGVINDLFSGGTLNTRLASLAPVTGARTSAAKTRFDTISRSLDETLGRLNASMARRGFGGGSSFDNNQLFGATLSVRQQAADALAAAQLQNAQDEAALRDSDTLMRLSSVGLPYEQASRVAALQELPISTVGAGASQALAPLNFFRMGQSTWQASPLPAVQPTASTGQIVGQGVASLGSSLGNYFAARDVARQYGQSGAIAAPTYAMPQATPTYVPMTNANYSGYTQVPAYVLPASSGAGMPIA